MFERLCQYPSRPFFRALAGLPLPVRERGDFMGKGKADHLTAPFAKLSRAPRFAPTMETQSPARPQPPTARRLFLWFALLVVGALIIGAVSSTLSRRYAQSAGKLPESSWPTARDHLLPSLQKQWTGAGQQLKDGELGAAYESIIFGRRLLAPFLPAYGNEPIQRGQAQPTLQEFYDDWQKKFAAGLDQGLPAILRRLGEGREKLVTVGDFKQVGFPQLADTVLQHKEEIIAARAAAAPRFLRVDLAGPASYHELLEKNLRAKFPPGTDGILLFEAPLSAAEEAATWRSFTYGVDEKLMRYFDGPDQKQPPLLALPSSATVIWTVHPGPGRATTWDRPFTHPFTSGVPATLRVIKNFFGQIVNQGDWPQPAPFAQKLSSSINTWLEQNLPPFAVKDASVVPVPTPGNLPQAAAPDG